MDHVHYIAELKASADIYRIRDVLEQQCPGSYTPRDYHEHHYMDVLGVTTPEAFQDMFKVGLFRSEKGWNSDEPIDIPSGLEDSIRRITLLD